MFSSDLRQLSVLLQGEVEVESRDDRKHKGRPFSEQLELTLMLTTVPLTNTLSKARIPQSRSYYHVLTASARLEKLRLFVFVRGEGSDCPVD